MKTVGDFLDAMEKNGYPQITGTLFVDVFEETEDGILSRVVPEMGGCALGQALFNLFPDMPLNFPENAEFTENILQQLNAVTDGEFCHSVVDLNDYGRKTIPEIAQQMRENYKDMLEFIFYED